MTSSEASFFLYLFFLKVLIEFLFIQDISDFSFLSSSQIFPTSTPVQLFLLFPLKNKKQTSSRQKPHKIGHPNIQAKDQQDKKNAQGKQISQKSTKISFSSFYIGQLFLGIGLTL